MSIFKDIHFEALNTDPYAPYTTYAVLAELHDGTKFYAKVKIHKTHSTNIDDLKKQLVKQLIADISKEIKKETNEAYNGWLAEIHTQAVDKSLVHHTTITDPVNSFNVFNEPLAHYHMGGGGAKNIENVSIFDIKKTPKYIPAESQSLGGNAEKVLLDYIENLKSDKINHTNMLSIALNKFPGLNTIINVCPSKCDVGDIALSDIIIHLNDSHQWPRERIADWLDTLDIDLSVPIQKEGSNAH